MFVDQVLPDAPDPEALCVVCFECAVGCETAEIGECKLVVVDDDVDDDRLCASPWLLDGLLDGTLCDEVGVGWEVGSADTLREDVGVSTWLDDACKERDNVWVQVVNTSMQQSETLNSLPKGELGKGQAMEDFSKDICNPPKKQ